MAISTPSVVLDRTIHLYPGPRTLAGLADVAVPGSGGTGDEAGCDEAAMSGSLPQVFAMFAGSVALPQLTITEAESGFQVEDPSV
jgi:hypothetical protein